MSFSGGPLESLPQVSPIPQSSSPVQLTSAQMNQLRAQVNVYKLLSHNEPVSAELAAQAVIIKQQKTTSLLPEAYEFPGEAENGDKLPYDLMKVRNPSGDIVGCEYYCILFSFPHIWKSANHL